MNIITQFKDILIETLKENKKLILICYALFIVSFILAAVFSVSVVESAMSNLPNSAESNGNMDLGAMDIFIKNESGGIITYIASIFFGIFAIVALIYNGANLGMTGNLLANFMPGGWTQYIAYLIPHGIFEITALVIQSAAGILLWIFIWNFLKGFIKGEGNGFKEKALESYDANKKKFIQSLVLMIFGTILLIIAAPIETYISVPLSSFILGV